MNGYGRCYSKGAKFFGQKKHFSTRVKKSLKSKFPKHEIQKMDMSGAYTEPLTVLKLVYKQSQERQNMLPVRPGIYRKKCLTNSLQTLDNLAPSL